MQVVAVSHPICQIRKLKYNHHQHRRDFKIADVDLAPSRKRLTELRRAKIASPWALAPQGSNSRLTKASDLSEADQITTRD